MPPREVIGSQKPTDIYSVILIVAAVFLLGAIVITWLELTDHYEFLGTSEYGEVVDAEAEEGEAEEGEAEEGEAEEGEAEEGEAEEAEAEEGEAEEGEAEEAEGEEPEMLDE